MQNKSETSRKKLLIVALIFVFWLSGCKSTFSKTEPVVKVYTAKTDIGDGLQLEEKWTIEGWNNDYLARTVMVYTYHFDDVVAWADYIAELERILDNRINELQGPQGSRYTLMEYKMDGKDFVISEVTDYEAACKNNEAVMLNDEIEPGEYYSMSKLCENFDLQKYTLQN